MTNAQRSDMAQRIVAYIAAAWILTAGEAPEVSNEAIPRDYPQRNVTSRQLREWRDEARRMFYFGYDNYMRHAFPLDELDPIHCRGRGPDYEHPENINVNDALGNYSLSLIDSLDTLALIGNWSEFRRAVRITSERVSFDQDSTVQVFESTIRVMGGLLSAHLIASDSKFALEDYDGTLLDLAHDLGRRLLPAFRTRTGIPYPRVHLRKGVPEGTSNETCTSGAGSLLLEFGVLSRLTGESIFETVAHRSVLALWQRRSSLGLVGRIINVNTGTWSTHGQDSGIGAGIDSFFEILLKAYILFGCSGYSRMFNQAYSAILKELKYAEPPLYLNVNMHNGQVVNQWVDSLQAYFAGLQVLAGDVANAARAQAAYMLIWKRYGALPERFNWKLRRPEVAFYPLRPELIESTYHLHAATRRPQYLRDGAEMMAALQKHAKVECGYATIHNVEDKSVEDRMESFFLSETTKYLYLLFETSENKSNSVLHRLMEGRSHQSLVFSTQAHPLWLPTARAVRPYRSQDAPGDGATHAPSGFSARYGVGNSGAFVAAGNEKAFHHYATPRDKKLRCDEKEWGDVLLEAEEESPDQCARVPDTKLIEPLVDEATMRLLRSTIIGG